jgi:hypothetical protein
MNIHQSQVDDTTFVNSADLSPDEVQNFLVTEGTFLSKFYLIDYTDGDVNSGFFDYDGDGVYHSADGDEPYCSDGSTTCVPDGTLASAGRSAAAAISQAAYDNGVNPKLLLVKLQVEQIIISAPDLLDTSQMNWAEGCASPSTFMDQLECAGQAYIDNYDETPSGTSPSTPYFWPVIASTPPTSDQIKASIQYAYAAPPTPPSASCNDGVLHTGCGLVSLYINNAATYAQYHYTPFMQTNTAGGGVRLFEQLWAQYSSKW